MSSEGPISPRDAEDYGWIDRKPAREAFECTGEDDFVESYYNFVHSIMHSSTKTKYVFTATPMNDSAYEQAIMLSSRAVEGQRLIGWITEGTPNQDGTPYTDDVRLVLVPSPLNMDLLLNPFMVHDQDVRFRKHSPVQDKGILKCIGASDFVWYTWGYGANSDHEFSTRRHIIRRNVAKSVVQDVLRAFVHNYEFKNCLHTMSTYATSMYRPSMYVEEEED